MSDLDFITNETSFDDIMNAIGVEHNRTMYGNIDIEVRYKMHLT